MGFGFATKCPRISAYLIKPCSRARARLRRRYEFQIKNIGKITARPKNRLSQFSSISDNPRRAAIRADSRDTPTTNGDITSKKIKASKHPHIACRQCQCRRRISSNASNVTNNRKYRKNIAGSRCVRLSLTSEIFMCDMAAAWVSIIPCSSMPSIPETAPTLPTLPRFSAVGCTWRCGQYARQSRF